MTVSRWRFLMAAWIMALLYSVGLVLPAMAETKSSAAESFMKLISREGEKNTALKRQAAAKKAKKAALPDPDPEESKLEMTAKTLSGVISARNAMGMAVEYERDEAKGSSTEVWVNFTKKIKYSGFRELKDLQEGDTVRITVKETKDQKKRLLKEIALVAKKPKEDPATVAAAKAEALKAEAEEVAS